MTIFPEDEAKIIRNMLVQAGVTRILVKIQHFLRILALLVAMEVEKRRGQVKRITKNKLCCAVIRRSQTASQNP